MSQQNYIILSLKHSEGKEPTFWRPDNSGYTNYPWGAGVYSHEEVSNRNGYYNDGSNTLAIPLTNAGLESIGFKCQMDLKKVKELATKARGGKS